MKKILELIYQITSFYEIGSTRSISIQLRIAEVLTKKQYRRFCLQISHKKEKSNKKSFDANFWQKELEDLDHISNAEVTGNYDLSTIILTIQKATH